MRLALSSLLSLALAAVSPIAWALDPMQVEVRNQLEQAAPPPPAPPRERPFFVGATGGVAWASAEHPELLSSDFTAATLGLHAGYVLSPQFALGFELTTIEKTVAKDRPGGLFAPAGAVGPQAECNGCQEPIPGGELMQVTAVWGTLGPRLEYTPFGGDGLFVGASGGVAFLMGLEGRTGLGGTARAGFRLRAAEVITFAVEGGVQGQTFADASVFMPFVAASFRPYF